MRWYTWGVLVVWGVCLSVLPGLAQDDNMLAPFSSVTGDISGGEVDEWRMAAVDGEIISLIAEGTGDFDPVITLLSETGAVLLENDDYDYPNTQTAALQAVTAPFTGTFTVQVRGFDDSAGAYTLTRLRGFADGVRLNGFVAGDDWESANEDLDVSLEDGRLSLGLVGNDVSGFVVDEGAALLMDYYAQVTVTVENGSPGWVVHTTARQQNASLYYVLSVSNQGFWRFVLRTSGSETLLHDWTTHPAIPPGETTFDLGMWNNGSTVGVFYNGSPLGYFTDETLVDGVIGFGLETSPGLNSTVGVTFSDLVITAPLMTASEDDVPVNRVIIRDSSAMARSLEHRRIIPAGGELALNVPQSTAQLTTPGVLRVPLGRGSTFENFVLAADVSVQAASSEPAGCGLFLRATEEDRYVLAYLDQTGAYGLSERQGEAFLPGVFGQREDWQGGEHQLLVIAHDDAILYFIDGMFVGQIVHEAAGGAIGNAAVNFEPNVTNCTFDNTWLWTWE